MDPRPSRRRCRSTAASSSRAASITIPATAIDLQLTNLGAMYDPVANTWTPLGHPKRLEVDRRFAVGRSTRWAVLGRAEAHASRLDPRPSNAQVEEVRPHRQVGLQRRGGLDASSQRHGSDGGRQERPQLRDLRPRRRKSGRVRVRPSSTCTRRRPMDACCTDPSEIATIRRVRSVRRCCVPTARSSPPVRRPTAPARPHGDLHDFGSRRTWTVGPDFPNGDNAGDDFAVLLPSGNVLVFGDSGEMYEFNGTSWAQDGFALRPAAAAAHGTGADAERSLYTPSGSPKASWAPTIKTAPTVLPADRPIRSRARSSTACRQAMAFGDEFENATNYPLVRITNNSTKHVFYARTHDHSTMGVATGTKVVSTNFDVPRGSDTGASTLVVVANGIASKPVNVTVK